MKPFREYDLSKIIANQWAAVQKKIDTMSNEEIMANNLEILAGNVYQEFFIEPVTIFEEDYSRRSIRQGKIQRYIDPFFRDYSGKEYVEVDGIIATFCFPFQGDSQLFWCKASSFSLGGYPEFFVERDTVVVRIERSLADMDRPNAKDELFDSLNHVLTEIKHGVGLANNDVNAFNHSLEKQAFQLIQDKHNKVKSFYDIATMLEVPIEKKEYAMTHIPLKRKIVPTAKKYQSSNYYGISDADYNDILETIKHTASTYERTPASYKSLHEEDLRNTLLASLNGLYKGDATGETFRNTGKTDICIERENRAAFVAECKMWTGQKEVEKAIEQLDGYLTWRDCKTALIYFVRRKEFMKVLESAESALRAYEKMKNVKGRDKNDFECMFLSQKNPGQQINMRVMLFNLFSE